MIAATIRAIGKTATGPPVLEIRVSCLDFRTLHGINRSSDFSIEVGFKGDNRMANAECRLNGHENKTVSADGSDGLNRIRRRAEVAENIFLLDVYCPEIATYCRPGHFIVVRMDEVAERVPLTIADFDRQAGTITMVIQALGTSTRKLAGLREGDKILDVVGPLGHPTEIKKLGNVVVVGGGVGIAPVHPIARGLKAAGNRVTSIIGARNGKMLFWENEMRRVSDELLVVTDDGSSGRQGLVTAPLAEMIARGDRIDAVWAVGPVVMMNAVCRVTEDLGIRTWVSLNSIMVDGTGMCGGCRVEVGGETKFTCVDGPEFDGHRVNFPQLLARLSQYRDQEGRSLKQYEKLTERSAGIAKATDRVPMPEQDAKDRRRNFNEVALGYTEEMAQSEALRCLQCKKAPCTEGCPVQIDIPGFIKLIQAGRFLDAAKKLKEENSLPAVCGRVCPQETQCEEKCVLDKKGKPIAIGRLERFAADYEARHSREQVERVAASKGKKVAMVGSGPACLTCAGDLIKLGYDVHVYEALHKSGGVLVYGIPEFRLPKEIVQRECDNLAKLGVRFRMNMPIGPCRTVQELLAGEYSAVFLGLGAGLPSFMNIPGENLNGVMSSNEFLTRANLMKAYLFPEYDTPVLVGRNVAVVGGGNVAMDAARCALRLGAENVYLVYRRSREEMPAREEEIHHAFEEGVQLMPLNNPVEIIGNADGWVTGVRCIRMELGEPDASGRRRPIPIKGSEHVIAVDQFVVAIGNAANPMLTKTFPELALNKWGNIVADSEGHTNVKGVFAGGDIVTGAATVIEAMGAGKIAAKSIDRFLTTGEWPGEHVDCRFKAETTS